MNLAIRGFGFLALTTLLPNCRTVTKSDSDLKFGAGEHLMLGDKAYRRAMGLEKSSNIDAISRADGKIVFSYGTLVALSGDFYASPQDLDQDKESKGFWESLNPMSEYNNVKATVAAFKAEESDIQKQKSDANQKVVDKNFEYLTRFGIDYLEISACNVDHFGWQNMKRYVAEHKIALDLALKANQSENSRDKAEFYRQALIHNGFADHFLSDAFAAGHMRIPRAQALTAYKMDCSYREGENRNDRSLRIIKNTDGRKVGALTKIQHDLDHSPGAPGRLKVKNARGDSWQTRNDGQLYVLANDNAQASEVVTEAIKISLEEVLTAYREGSLPSGIYGATELVPFMDPSEKKLVDIFSPNLSEAEIQAYAKESEIKLPPVIKTIVETAVVKVDANTVRDYFKQMPTLMENFRAQVASDVKNNPELRQRLPAAYLEGYSKVQ